MRSLVIGAVGAAILTGCATTPGKSVGNPAKRLNEDVFSEGYALIDERYIEPVAISDLALDGMEALSDLDSGIKVSSSGGKVVLAANNAVVREFPAPSRNDTDAWGELTAKVVRASQKVSPDLRTAGSEKVYETVFDGAMANLDRYSRYAGADEARNERADREGFGGIGIHLSVNDGITRVVAVMPETPASRAGVKDNDVITTVEGEAIAGLELRDVVRRLRGIVGSFARFTVERQGTEKVLEFAVKRELIIPTSVIYRREDNVAYIRITRFNQGTARNFREHVAKAKRELGSNLDGIILDLRDNPGGLLDQAVAVADSLLRGGKIVSTRGRHRGSFQQYDASGEDIANGLPLVVLINRGSASASEIVAAALQDDGRAVIVGTNSYGKGVVQSVYRLPNDGELTLTWSRFHAPSGYNLQDLGVLPTICTSGKNRDPKRLLSAVREGRTGTAARLANWRRDVKTDEKTRQSMREQCPSAGAPKNGEDRDLKVARAVLSDQALYSIALKQSTIPELAQNQ